MSNNTSLFEYLQILQRNGYLKTAMDEADLFLKEMARVHGANPAFAQPVIDREKDLTNLMSRYATWRSNHDRMDSRDTNTEIRQINHALTELISDLKKLPEIGYIHFGKVEKTGPIRIPTEPKVPRWLTPVLGVVFLFILGFMAWPFIPKGTVDKSQCYVTTKPFFAGLSNEPQFVPTPMTTLPGTKSYKVEDVAELRLGKKSYKITDEKLHMTGWINDDDLKFISPNCFVAKAAPPAYDLIFTDIQIFSFGPLPAAARNYQVCFSAKADAKNILFPLSGTLGTFIPAHGIPQVISVGNQTLEGLSENNQCAIHLGLDNQMSTACGDKANVHLIEEISLKDLQNYGNTPIVLRGGGFTVQINFRIRKAE